MTGVTHTLYPHHPTAPCITSANSLKLLILNHIFNSKSARGHDTCIVTIQFVVNVYILLDSKDIGKEKN